MEGKRRRGFTYSMESAERGRRGGRNGRKEIGKAEGSKKYLPASGDSMVTSVAPPSPAEVEADTDTL